MADYCNADCGPCEFKACCAGCEKSCGKPFGKRCIAAQYVSVGGADAYRAFKETLRGEINGLLNELGIPETETLYELPGRFVNLAYTLPGGQKTRFLDDDRIYLCAQFEMPGEDHCCGVCADMEMILISSYEGGGANPELLVYKKR